MLVVAWDHDPITPHVNHRGIAALVPAARLHAVRGGGHVALFDSAAEAGPVITGFLDTRPGTAEVAGSPLTAAGRSPAGRTSLIADQLPGCRPAGRPPAVRPVTIDLRTKNTHRYADNRPGRPRAPARRLSGVSRLPSPHGLAHSLLAGSRKDIVVSRQESLAPLCLTAHTAWSLGIF